jgi:hypothetical protein
MTLLSRNQREGRFAGSYRGKKYRDRDWTHSPYAPVTRFIQTQRDAKHPWQHIQLVDGVERNQRHPNTFHIPTEDEKALVQPGDHVQISFEWIKSPDNTPNGERMWVQVTAPGKGKLDNDPTFLPIKHGEIVEFDARHIIGIIHN